MDGKKSKEAKFMSELEEPKFIELKVYKNKRTGQGIVMLPKKCIKKLPSKVKLKW